MADVTCKLTNDGFILKCICGAKHEGTVKVDKDGNPESIEVETTYVKQKVDENPPKKKSIWVK